MRGPPGAALAFALGLLLLPGCAAKGTAPREAHDPFESINRKVFAFNEAADRWFLEPVARGWDWIAPERVEQSVSNFFANLRTPAVFANNLLQGKPLEAQIELARLVVNSTIGIAGLFDPARHWLGLERNNEDFGQTLAEWHFARGPYLVLPLLGPSSVRDVFRYPVDGMLNSLPLQGLGPWVMIRGFSVINTRAQFLEELDDARAQSFDYYAFVRQAWWELRTRQELDGKVPAADPEDLYYPDDDLYYFEDDEELGAAEEAGYGETASESSAPSGAPGSRDPEPGAQLPEGGSPRIE